MQRLSPEHYDAVRPLIGKIPFNTIFLGAVLSGGQPGWVYGDDPHAPRTAVVLQKCGIALLLGSPPTPEVGRWLRDALRGRFHLGPRQFLLAGATTELDAALDALIGEEGVTFDHAWLSTQSPDGLPERVQALNAAKVLRTPRYEFAWDPASAPKLAGLRKAIPPAFQIEPIDARRFSEIEGINRPDLFWDDAETFARVGSGRTLIHEGRIASTAFGAFVDEGKVDVGVETGPEFRGQNLAVGAAAAFIQTILEGGREPVGGCMETNRPSARVAEKLGFRPLGLHPTYRSIPCGNG